MLSRLGQLFDRVAQRVVPDPFVLALILTAFVMLAGLWSLSTGAAPLAADAEPLSDTLRVLRAWFTGFSNPAGLAFALQMALVLVTGQALALSRPMTRLLESVAGLPRTTSEAAALVAFITCIASILHWGLGAIAGAIVARAVFQTATSRGLHFHYPLLGAAGYTGFAVFHGGLSGSAPLKVAEQNHFLAETIGVIPISQTLGSPLNIAIVATLTLLFPALFYALAPSQPATLQGGGTPSVTSENPGHPNAGQTIDRAAVPDSGAVSDASTAPDAHTISDKASTPFSLAALLAGWLPLGVVLWAIFTGFLTFDINAFTLVFLFAGIGLHGHIQQYIDTATDAARAAGPILLQYPFYFAIVAIMQATGLIVTFSEFFVRMATAETFPVIAFWSAAILNVVIPSGGGQWAVQGPILTQAGMALGVDPGVIVIAFAHGDASTNLLQPFWALPLLGLMGLRANQIIGYSAIACAAMLGVISVLLVIMT
jgi:short-chain fatty acids transporter